MTNDTNYRKKANAVFFAAIMVVSMVAIGFAAAPAAAAVTDLSNGSADDVTVGSEAAPQEVTFDVTIEEGDTDVPVTVDLSAAAGAGVVPTVDDVSSESDDVTVSDGGIDGGVHTVEVTDANDTDGDHTATITVNYEHDTTDATATADVVFDIEDDDASATTTATFDLVDAAPSYDPDSNLYYAGQEIEVSGLAPNTDYQLREVTDRNDDGDISSSGPVEQFATDADGAYTIDTDDLETGDYFLRGPGIDDEEATEFEVSVQSLSTEFDEDEVDEGDEVDLEVDSNRGTYSMNVTADGLDADELADVFRNVDSVDEDDDEDRVTLNDISDGDIETNFTDVDAGEYEFEFEVTDTEASDTASINVTEDEDGELDIADSVIAEQGDVAAITVELDEDTEDGTVVIGNEEDDGYQANVTIEDADDEEVEILFNTYTAGSGDGEVVATTSDADVALDSETDDLTDLLDTGTYDISVSTETGDDRFEDTLDDPDSISSLSVEERSTETSLALWRTSESVEDDIADELDDEDENATVTLINEAVEGELVTETDSLAIDDDGARGDVLVHQFTASGLRGAFADAEGNLDEPDSTDALYALLQEDNSDYDLETTNSDDKLEIVLEEQNPGTNQEANEIDVNAIANEVSSDAFSNIFTVVYDDQTNNYYIVANADNLNTALDDNDLGAEPIEDEDEYEVQISVQDARLLDLFDEDDEDDFEDAYETTSANFTVVEAEGDFDNEDEIEVAAAENQSITGTANVAPGTEIDVRVRSDDDASTSFIMNDEDIAVSSNGTFEANFDFSDQEVNDTFTAEVRQAAFDAESDGTVVEAADDGDDGNATFEVSNLDPEEATITAGDALTVSATIENTGDSNATQSVALTLDGEELDSQEVTLEGGNSTTVEFTDVDTSGLEAGEYTHGIATDGDEQTGTLIVESADGDDGADGNDTDGDDGTDDGDDGMDGDDGADGNDTDGDDGTDDSTPGFGALVALVALIAAALLATRRHE
jgi:PGF-CTERM protein/surface glycoprotein (TIGR04207 family)